MRRDASSSNFCRNSLALSSTVWAQAAEAVSKTKTHRTDIFPEHWQRLSKSPSYLECTLHPLNWAIKHAHIIHCLCISTYRHFKYNFIFLIQPSEELSILTIKSTCTCVCLVSALRCGEFRVRVLKSHEHETCLFYLKGNIVFVKFAVWKYVSDN